MTTTAPSQVSGRVLLFLRRGVDGGRCPHEPPGVPHHRAEPSVLPPDYIVQFEEDRFQPGTWHNHSRYPGSVNSAVLSLSPYVNYQFRVIAVNDVGSSLPSVPSERYQTNGAREYRSQQLATSIPGVLEMVYGDLGNARLIPCGVGTQLLEHEGLTQGMSCAMQSCAGL